MRLQQLEIDNFRVIRRARLEFSDSVIGVVGPNGAGKSSLVEAIAWVLYGNTAARSGKDEIKSVYAGRNDDCRVRLGFALNGDSYTIERSLIGARERPEARVLRGDRVAATGATETTRLAAGLLGLDWRGFLTSFLARQQELNALADLPPHQRRDHLAGMLGIERLDRVLQKLRQDRRVLDERASLLAEQAGRLAEVTNQLAQNTEHIARLEPIAAQSQGALDTAAAAHRRTEQDYREHQEKRLQCSEIDAKLDSARRTLGSLIEQAEATAARKTELEAGRDRLARLQQEIVRIEPLRARREQLRKAVAQAALVEQIRTQLKQATDAHLALSVRATPLRDEAARIEAALRVLPPGIDVQVETATAELEEIRSRYSETRAGVQATEKELARLNEQVEAIGQIGPEAVCDRCRRPFGDDLPGIRQHLEAEQVALSEALSARSAQLNELSKQGQARKDALAGLQEKAQHRRETAFKAESVGHQLRDIEERLAETARRRTELAAKLDELGTPEVETAELNRVETELAELEHWRDETLELQGRLTELPTLIERLTGIRSQITELNNEVAKLESERQTIAYDAALFARVTDDYESSRQALDAARQAHTEAVKELEIARNQHQMRQEEQDRLQKAAGQLETCRGDIFYAEKLGQLFGDFRKVMIAGIRPRLADLAGRLMTEMSGGKYSLVDLDPDYNLRIMDFGQYYGIDRFSGGEKDLASLCLRLAISLALTESAGMTRSFVILDEVFGSQDSGRRDLILEALGGLKARFPQMILITHLEELKHKVETLIEVIPTAGGWSEVSCNGDSANN